jgi:dCTP deaminase
MAFWSGQKLKREMPALVTDYSSDRVDCAAYTLRMGRQYYLSASEVDADRNKLEILPAGESLAIPSGQFAVLLTEETVTVPAGKIAFISIRTGLKSRGLVNVSGFHVDPGYSAPLRFAVFNAGPSTICVRQGEACFLIWYADLDQKDLENTKKDSHNRIYREGINSADVATLTGAVKSISVLEKKVRELDDNQKWMRWYIGLLSWIAGILSGVILSMLGFLAYQGIKSFLTNIGSGLGH